MKDKLKVGYLITGRLKSTRLPRKLLLEIKNKPFISHMIDRLKMAEKVDEIIICTSIKHQDAPLGDIAKENNIQCYFGDPDDVLVRLLGAADQFGLDYILNITADCPFADPFYADKIVDKYLETNADLIRQFDLPHGAFSYGIKIDALRKVVELKRSNDTEVWGRYFTDTGQFNVLDLDVENKHHKRPGLRMTLDYPEDFQFFKAIFELLYVEGTVFSLTDILSVLDTHPEIIEINKNCGRRFSRRFVSQSEPKLIKVNNINTALIIGSGPIALRHIKNLKRIGINDIVALRSQKCNYKNLSAELKVIEVDKWEDAINKEPDIAVIANPAISHTEAVNKVLKHVKGVFIEKPLSYTISECERLVDALQDERVISFVGYNIMFHPIVKNIRRFINKFDVGDIINIQCQVGQWSPISNPYEESNGLSYSRSELVGWVSLTQNQEINLALSFAGLPSYVFGEISKKKLDIDADVFSNLTIKHILGAVSQIHLDYRQKPSRRTGLINFERGWLAYDFNKLELTGQGETDEPKVIWSDIEYDGNEMYVEQLNEFLRYVEEGRVKNKFDAVSSLESLKVVEALLESSRSGKMVSIQRDERFSF